MAYHLTKVAGGGWHSTLQRWQEEDGTLPSNSDRKMAHYLSIETGEGRANLFTSKTADCLKGNGDNSFLDGFFGGLTRCPTYSDR